MSLPIASLMQRRVRTVVMEATLAELEALFGREHLSWAPVLDAQGVPVGAISAADLLRARSQGQDAAAVQAWQLCSYKPVAVAPQAPVAEVAALMAARHVHHVLVMEGPDIAGVVSALDLVRCLAVEAATPPAAPV